MNILGDPLTNNTWRILCRQQSQCSVLELQRLVQYHLLYYRLSHHLQVTAGAVTMEAAAVLAAATRKSSTPVLTLPFCPPAAHQAQRHHLLLPPLLQPTTVQLRYLSVILVGLILVSITDSLNQYHQYH